MRKFIISLITAVIAGGIVIIPIVIKKFDLETVLTAFTHVTVMGLFIPYINIHARSWVKGLLVMMVTTIPLFVIVNTKMPEMLLLVILVTAVLGALIGLISAHFFVRPGIKL